MAIGKKDPYCPVPMAHRLRFIRFPGGNGEGATPVPIPNTEVKPFSADGTTWVAGWESRTLPGIFFKARFQFRLKTGFFYVLTETLPF